VAGVVAMAYVKSASKFPVIRLDVAKILPYAVMALLFVSVLSQYLEKDSLAVFSYEITSRLK
jgi:hypothetical protein